MKETKDGGFLVVKVCSDEESMSQAAARIFVERFQMTIGATKRFSVALSGGSTPLRTYELLAKEPFRSQIDWSRVHVFWGDERCVPVTDARSNYKAANEIFLSRVPIPLEQIHPILCIQEPHQSAAAYEGILRAYFGDSSPCFDLLFLGLGKDGHTASLIPLSAALEEKVKWVTRTQSATEDFARVTLTLQLLNHARMTLFLVAGNEKADILKDVLNVDEPSPALPASFIRPAHGELLWLVDRSTQIDSV